MGSRFRGAGRGSRTRLDHLGGMAPCRSARPALRCSRCCFHVLAALAFRSLRASRQGVEPRGLAEKAGLVYPHHGTVAPGPRVERGSRVLEARLLPEHPATKMAAGFLPCGHCLVFQLLGGPWLHAATSGDIGRTAGLMWATERARFHRQLDAPRPLGVPHGRVCRLGLTANCVDEHGSGSSHVTW